MEPIDVLTDQMSTYGSGKADIGGKVIGQPSLLSPPPQIAIYEISPSI